MRGGNRWGFALALAGCLLVTSSCSERVDPVAEQTTGTSIANGPSSTPGPDRLWGSAVRPPIRIEPFTLTDQEGRPFRFPLDVGRPVVTLLYFGYTHCPDICPDTMAEIAVALRQVPPAVAERVAVVFVTVDPARDDPARLREWIGLFGEDFTALTGPPRRIEQVLWGLGYQPGIVTDLGGGEYLGGHPAEYLAIRCHHSAPTPIHLATAAFG